MGGDSWAKVTIDGQQCAEADDDVKFNTEYVHLVPWNDNAELSKVTATVRVKGWSGDQGDVYTLSGIPQYDKDGKLEKYVVYVPTIGKNIPTRVESVTAVTDEDDGRYAKVRVLGPTEMPASNDGYAVHTYTYTSDTQLKFIDVTNTGDPLNDSVTMLAQVLASKNYYAGPAKPWPIELRPVDMSLDKVQVSSNGLVQALQTDENDGNDGDPYPVDDQLRYRASIQPFRLLDAQNQSLEKVLVALHRSDPSLKVEFGYIPIPANAADLPKYEGKYGNYLSSDADVLWSPVYDQNSPLTNWDSTNYISDGVDLYDGVEASTMVKIRVGYWLDLDDGTGTNTTVPTRVSYVDYSVNAQRMNDDARKLGLDLGLTKDEPTDEAWRRYAIDRLETVSYTHLRAHET